MPKWWRRPWVAPLFVVTFIFLAFSLPPYLALDPALARLPVREELAWHFPALVGHIAFGTVALITCCLQVWPWLRQKHPKFHRISGRVYVLSGVLPAGLLGIFVGAAAVIPGFAGRAGNVTLAVVWLFVTFMGFRAARGKRFAEHRRWMIRSFALCTSIVVNRLWTVACLVIVLPFPGEDEAKIRSAVEAAIWLSWIVNLLIAEWWLERRRVIPRASASAPRGVPAAQEA